MRKEIYPDGGCKNNFSDLYCKIAMENYHQASIFYNKIQDANFSFDTYAEEKELQKKVISTIVFSAMCLESFFNDYIAAVLGDDRFYKIYDGLTPQNKFCFISEFIFGKKVDRSQKYYGGIKKLVQYRNNYVHNKSSNLDLRQFAEHQTIEPEDLFKKLNDSAANKTRVDMILRDGLESLKTIRNVAKYFDKYDTSCYAMVRLFGEHNYVFASSYEKIYLEKIFQELGIVRK